MYANARLTDVNFRYVTRREGGIEVCQIIMAGGSGRGSESCLLHGGSDFHVFRGGGNARMSAHAPHPSHAVIIIDSVVIARKIHSAINHYLNVNT